MTDNTHKAARRIGALVQGLGLGLLLFIAVCGLVQASGVGQVFRYQGF
jgi:hypothetical protein